MNEARHADQLEQQQSQLHTEPHKRLSLSAHSPSFDSHDSSSASEDDQRNPDILTPIPTRPKLPNRKSSGTIIVPRDSEDAFRPVETRLDAGDVRAMSPRRTSEDLEELGRQTRDEVRKHAKMLQDSLLLIFHRIQAVKEEHDKLDNHNKFLQKYIGDLMSTSKITSTSTSTGRSKK